MEQLRWVLPGHLAWIRPCAQVELPSHMPGRCCHLQRCWESPRALPALHFAAKDPDSSLRRWLRLAQEGLGSRRWRGDTGSGTVAMVAQGRVWGHFPVQPAELV